MTNRLPKILLAAALVPAPLFALDLESPDPFSESAVSVEASYGFAFNDLFDFDDDDESNPSVDVAGITLRYTKPLRALTADGNLVPEVFGLAGIAYGSDEIIGREWDYSWKKTYSVVQAQLAVGGNLRYHITEHVSVFGGARIGAGYTAVKFESEENHREDYDNTQDAVGFLYGGGLGVDFKVTELLGLRFAWDYIGSTARPKFDDLKAERQSYGVFSVGVNFRF